MEIRVVLTPQAERDLLSIGRYIARADTRAAYRFCNELVAAAESLRTFPDRHGEFVKHPNIRKRPYQTYIIFYKIYDKEQIVEILRFWHAARDQRKLRLKEEVDIAYGSSAQVAKLEA